MKIFKRLALLVPFACVFLVEVIADPELKIEVISSPKTCNRKSKKGDVLQMHYTGTLLDGTIFDSSSERGEPFTFQVGMGEVIQGWDGGLMDMCVGEKRKLTIPPELGYGSKGAGPKIPPDSTLIFEVELLSAEVGPAPRNIFNDIDSDGDGLLSQDEMVRYTTMMSEALRRSDPEMPKESEEEMQDMVDAIFGEVDWNADDHLDLKEFTRTEFYEIERDRQELTLKREARARGARSSKSKHKPKLEL